MTGIRLPLSPILTHFPGLPFARRPKPTKTTTSKDNYIVPDLTAGDEIVCERQKPVGSHVSATICRTRAKMEKDQQIAMRAAGPMRNMAGAERQQSRRQRRRSGARANRSPPAFWFRRVHAPSFATNSYEKPAASGRALGGTVIPSSYGTLAQETRTAPGTARRRNFAASAHADHPRRRNPCASCRACTGQRLARWRSGGAKVAEVYRYFFTGDRLHVLDGRFHRRDRLRHRFDHEGTGLRRRRLSCERPIKTGQATQAQGVALLCRRRATRWQKKRPLGTRAFSV